MSQEEDATLTSKARPEASLSHHILGLDHVAIAVEDLEQAIDWYASALGFELVERRRTAGEATSMISAVLKAGSAIVVLVQGVEPESQVSRFVQQFGAGVQHVAFAVVDLDAALASVEASGGRSETGVLSDEGIRQTFLRRDPGSGVRVELIERCGGEFSDSSVERLFRSMERDGLF